MNTQRNASLKFDFVLLFQAILLYNNTSILKHEALVVYFANKVATCYIRSFLHYWIHSPFKRYALKAFFSGKRFFCIKCISKRSSFAYFSKFSICWDRLSLIFFKWKYCMLQAWTCIQLYFFGRNIINLNVRKIFCVTKKKNVHAIRYLILNTEN